MYTYMWHLYFINVSALIGRHTDMSTTAVPLQCILVYIPSQIYAYIYIYTCIYVCVYIYVHVYVASLLYQRLGPRWAQY